MGLRRHVPRRCRAERAGAAGGDHGPVHRCLGLRAPAGHSGGGAWPPPWLRLARHLGRERRPAGCGGTARPRRAGERQPGILESWEPAGLRGCGAGGWGLGAAARGRFSAFQDSRFSPSPRRRRRPGHGQLQRDRTREARNWKPKHLEICLTVTGFQVFQIPRFPAPLRSAGSGHRRAEFGPRSSRAGSMRQLPLPDFDRVAARRCNPGRGDRSS